MNKVKSLYLEILRILAAGYVFIYHVGAETISNELYLSNDRYNTKLGLNYFAAHFFVIVFFVLSGFLITMSANRPGITFREFMIARLGRLYSVLIPALTFSILLSVLLEGFGLIAKGGIENNDQLLSRFFLNFSFLSQSWTLCATPPLNRPFWSVSYEFMYYLLIAGYMLIKPAFKWIFLTVVLLVMGLKVFLLFPAWLIGSFLYFISLKKDLKTAIAFPIFIATTVIIAIAIIHPTYFPLVKTTNEGNLFGFTLFFSWNYLADYLFSIIVALNIYSFFGMSAAILRRMEKWSFSQKIFRQVKTIGNCTYTLYLFHVPLMILFATILPYDKNKWSHNFGLIILVAITVYFIARVTEWKVTYWRNLVEKFVRLFISKRPVKIEGNA